MYIHTYSNNVYTRTNIRMYLHNEYTWNFAYILGYHTHTHRHTRTRIQRCYARIFKQCTYYMTISSFLIRFVEGNFNNMLKSRIYLRGRGKRIWIMFRLKPKSSVCMCVCVSVWRRGWSAI